ncbi:hypothetical protein JNW91_28035 [Micromonospora sp. STR1_7]|uniref:Uncharacterized protein n=1 Tax=Micromonospora parastrephiae TaxID=2806101 RepID=A0ABS1Y1D2_9ACTN|nr:hypothetical protein [Micromonospora parastrephiae]MBM0235307.1 hypothetical protein [Micromonospora parastrephiae]
MAELSVKAVRGETEKAALQLLRERANLVGEAATARHERDQLAAALVDAMGRYAATYTAAVQGGWTESELAKLGLDAPESAPSRRRRAPRPATPPSRGEQTAVADEAAQP